MKRKVCRTCRCFVQGEICPICKKASFSTTFQGEGVILDAKRSQIAQRMGIEVPGEYAIKVR
jgi:DNA-directed RNA polymerase subunit E"